MTFDSSPDNRTDMLAVKLGFMNYNVKPFGLFTINCLIHPGITVHMENNNNVCWDTD